MNLPRMQRPEGAASPAAGEGLFTVMCESGWRLQMDNGAEKPQLVHASQGEGSAGQDGDTGPNWETQQRAIIWILEQGGERTAHTPPF